MRKCASSTLALDVQDEAAHMLLLFADGEESPIQFTPEEEVSLYEAEDEIARSQFATKGGGRGNHGDISPVTLLYTRRDGFRQRRKSF